MYPSVCLYGCVYILKFPETNQTELLVLPIYKKSILIKINPNVLRIQVYVI